MGNGAVRGRGALWFVLAFCVVVAVGVLAGCSSAPSSGVRERFADQFAREGFSVVR